MAVLLLGAVLVDGGPGLCAAVLHILPLFGLLAPLLFGRYVGEDVLARMRRAPRRRPRVQLAPRWATPPAGVARSLHLLAEHFGRPPPLVA